MKPGLEENNSIITQAHALLHFIQKMDIEMLDLILSNDYTYQDLHKSVFIRKLGYAFDEFMEAGNTYLNKYEGLCDAKICNYKCPGFTFIGNKTNHFFDLIIDIKVGVVCDIYECTILKNEKDLARKETRVMLNRLL